MELSSFTRNVDKGSPPVKPIVLTPIFEASSMRAIHVFCGSEDNFHLEEPTQLLCNIFGSLRSRCTCTIVERRDHMNLYDPSALYPEGLYARILREVRSVFDGSTNRS